MWCNLHPDGHSPSNATCLVYGIVPTLPYPCSPPMLSQLDKLSRDIDGRYATDNELMFLMELNHSFMLRVQTYRRIQELETTLVQQVYTQIQALDPTLLTSGGEDISRKWKGDTIRCLRYAAIALLLNDMDSLRERFLFWYQTIMRAFGAQRSCDVTYQIMQEVARKTFTPPQAELLCPILELHRQILGSK